MSKNLLPNYLSRAQIRDFLSYIIENGTDQIEEAPDSTTHDDPMSVQLGAAINSIKLFHVERKLNDGSDGDKKRLKQLQCVYVEDGIKPEAPDNFKSVGVFYMSKKIEHKGEADSFADFEHVGDIGDVVWMDSSEWGAMSPGASGDQPNRRLYVFWELK